MSKKILIIDDSALMRRVISDIIKKNNQYEVADFAHDGLEGLDKIISNPRLYDAIILDINMPKMNGLELLEVLHKSRIHQKIIVVSTVAKEGAKETIRALELGAFDFVTKPENFIEAKGDSFRDRLMDMLDIATGANVKVSAMAAMPIAETKTVSNTRLKTFASQASAKPEVPKRTANTMAVKMDSPANYKKTDSAHRLVALACSTGGPKSLQQVIPYLPADMDAGMVIVQHMPAGFTKSLAMRLNEMSKVTVKEAEEGDIIQKGTVYIAPGGRHMRLTRCGNDMKVALSDEAPLDGLRPCANVMYESLMNSPYDEIICVVLTGMGADGTAGIKKLKTSKKVFVVGQDEDSCIVYGMPRAIAEAGLVNEVKSLEEVADAITKKTGVR